MIEAGRAASGGQRDRHRRLADRGRSRGRRRRRPAVGQLEPPRQPLLALGRVGDGAERFGELVTAVGALDGDGGVPGAPTAVLPLQTGHLTVGQVLTELIPDGGQRGGGGQTRTLRTGGSE